MDPNSQHQLWSRWDVTVRPPKGRFVPVHARALDEIRDAWVRFVAKQFGTVGQVRLERRRRGLFGVAGVELFAQARVEGAPAHDPQYRDLAKRRIVTFFGTGFGPDTRVHIDVRIEAGDVQDGAPAQQLVVLPSIVPGVVDTPFLVNVAGPEALLRG